MNTKLAWLVSVLLHPLWMAMLAFGLAYQYCKPLFMLSEKGLGYFALYLALFTILIPLGGLLVLYRLKLVESLLLPTARERLLPYLMGLISTGVFAWVVVWRLSLGSFLLQLSLLPFFTLLLLWLAALAGTRPEGSQQPGWFPGKMSAHAASLGALSAFFGWMALVYPDLSLQWPFLALIMATGTVMTARLSLRAHTPAEVWGGLLLGVLAALPSVSL